MAAGNPVTVAERTQKHTSSVKSVPQHGCATFKATFGYSVGDFGFMKSPCSRAIREGSLHQVAASRSCAGCSAGRPDSFSVRPVGEVALPTAGQRSVVRPPASGSARERPDSGGARASHEPTDELDRLEVHLLGIAVGRRRRISQRKVTWPFSAAMSRSSEIAIRCV